MPRRVTKTMKAARALASKQKRERSSFQASIGQQDFNWTGDQTGRMSCSRPNKSAKPRSPTGRKQEEPVFIDIGVRKDHPSSSERTDLCSDLSKIEKRVISQMSEEEYAAREEHAQQEIDRKKTCIAPAYSKGAYQYITSVDMARDAGKKNS